MNSFDHMVLSLSSPKPIEVPCNPMGHKISKQAYDEFKKVFLFDSIKGISLSKSFCEYFHIKDDIVLMVGSSNDFAENYIKKWYLK